MRGPMAADAPGPPLGQHRQRLEHEQTQQHPDDRQQHADPYPRTSDHQWRGGQADQARHANGEQQVKVGEGHRVFHHPPRFRP